MCEVSDGDSPSGFDDAGHNIWNNVLRICFHFRIGPLFQDHLADCEVGQAGIALPFCPRQPVRLGLLRSLAAPCCYVTTTQRGM